MSGGPGWHLREMLEVKRCRIGDCEQENMHGSDLMFPSHRLYLPTLFENEQLLHPAPHRAGGRSSPAHPTPPPPSLLWEIIPQMANYFAPWRLGEEEGTGLSAQLQGNVLKYPFAPQNALDVPGSAGMGCGACRHVPGAAPAMAGGSGAPVGCGQLDPGPARQKRVPIRRPRPARVSTRGPAPLARGRGCRCAARRCR